MEPRHIRIDFLAELVRYLRNTTGTDVVTGMDAGANPTDTPVTVIQVPTVSPAGRLTRWAFDVSITVTTFAESSARAWGAHEKVCDAILDMSSLDSRAGLIRISSAVCTLEPVNVTGRNAPQWPGLLSNYTVYMRHERY